MKKSHILPLFGLLLLSGVVAGIKFQETNFSSNSTSENTVNSIIADQGNVDGGGLQNPRMAHPLSITALRLGNYPGSDLVIEQTLTPGSNYTRYIASYQSEGLKIYGLLTIPTTQKPAGGYPVVIFNHGYIPPAQYRTTERYIAYTDMISRAGYVLFRPDYRGHGSSEGEAAGGYGSNAYTIDVLNAVASLKKHPEVNAEKIGMWGHSMGGHITLRNMVVNKDVKAGVIWGGVVASYPDLLNNWRRNRPSPSPMPTNSSRSWRFSLQNEYGSPESNPSFWDSISATTYLTEISGPLQLHHGTADSSVPVEFSENLAKQMETLGLEVELYTYAGDDHDISGSFGTAMRRSVEFFDKHLK